MKIYKWIGSGHWLTAYIIVTAIDRTQAKQLIKLELEIFGLLHEWDLNNEVVEIPIDKSKIILSVNGDY